MRNTALAFLVAVLALAGVAVPPRPAAAADAPDPKVVIIVGATHSVTPTYRSYADQVYAEAIKYSSNVVRLYSPNATWAKVKAALQGASVVVYMGHGNGFPSPYATTPRPLTQNGFGLNDPAKGLSDYNNTYYGESYIGSEVQLAPNAVVFLHHLCYASGNSEPGNAEPSQSVAKARVDNYAAGFIKAGAAAVLADGHSHNPYYIRSLFTTHQTIEQIFRNAPNFHNHVLDFASTRSAGRTALMDPDTTTGGYYRSLVGKLTTKTDDVTGAAYAATDVDPGTFTVPGAASVNASGATLATDATLATPATTLPADTKLRLTEQAGTATDGSPVFAASTLDGSASGYVSGAEITPRDSSGPQVWTVDDGTGALSPNGDGRSDTYTLSARLSEQATWKVDFKGPDGTVLATKDGFGSQIAVGWNGLVGGKPVADGIYSFRIEARDGWGNPVGTKTGSFTVDTVAPVLEGAGAMTTASESPVVTFTPNGDGNADQVSLGYSTSEAGSLDVRVKNGGGTTVRSFSIGVVAGPGTVTWDGKADSGSTVADGIYSVAITPRDLAGNVGDALVRTVGVFSKLKSVKIGPSVFYPQDGDRYAKTTTLTFSLLKPATVTASIADGAGKVVRTIYTDAALAAGSYAFIWNGRTDGGTFVPDGTYYATVSATDGTLGTSTRVWTVASGFRITINDQTPVRRQKITVTAVTAETLGSSARLVVYQPGIAAWGVWMTKVSSTTYRATIQLKASGTGTVRFKVVGTDLGGGRNEGTLSRPLG